MINNSKRWIVLKFGGTSVSTRRNWESICQYIRTLLPEYKVWVTLSALSGVTNKLEECLKEAINSESGKYPSYNWLIKEHNRFISDCGLSLECFGVKTVDTIMEELNKYLSGISLTHEVSPKLKARILSYGEMCSTSLCTEYVKLCINDENIKVSFVDGRSIIKYHPDMNIDVLDHYLNAEIKSPYDYTTISNLSLDQDIVITQGFIATDDKNDVCLLGRNGSDTSAAIYSVLLHACRCEIWKDVHGFYTADPKIVKDALLIREISYRTAQEITILGAKVLHPRSISPCMYGDIPLEIRNTLDPDSIERTRISSLSKFTDKCIYGVVKRSNLSMIDIKTFNKSHTPGYLGWIFATIYKYGANIGMTASSTFSVSLVLDHIPGGVDGENFSKLVRELSTDGDITVLNSAAVVSIVGQHLRELLPSIGATLDIFQNHKIYLLSESSDDMNLSFVVENDNAEHLVQLLHSAFFDGKILPPIFGKSWSELTDQPIEFSIPKLKIPQKLSRIFKSELQCNLNTPKSPCILSTNYLEVLNEEWWNKDITKRSIENLEVINPILLISLPHMQSLLFKYRNQLSNFSLSLSLNDIYHEQLSNVLKESQYSMFINKISSLDEILPSLPNTNFIINTFGLNHHDFINLISLQQKGYNIDIILDYQLITSHVELFRNRNITLSVNLFPRTETFGVLPINLATVFAFFKNNNIICDKIFVNIGKLPSRSNTIWIELFAQLEKLYKTNPDIKQIILKESDKKLYYSESEYSFINENILEYTLPKVTLVISYHPIQQSGLYITKIKQIYTNNPTNNVVLCGNNPNVHKFQHSYLHNLNHLDGPSVVFKTFNLFNENGNSVSSQILLPESSKIEELLLMDNCGYSLYSHYQKIYL